MNKLLDLRHPPVKRLRRFKEVLVSLLTANHYIVRDGLNFDDVKVSINNGTITVSSDTEHLTELGEKSITFTYQGTPVEDLFSELGLSGEFSQFDLPMLTDWCDANGLEYIHDQDSHQLLIDVTPTTEAIDVENMTVGQTIAFTASDNGTHEIQLVNKLVNAKTMLRCLPETARSEYTVLLDIARHWLPIEDIKKFIQLAVTAKATRFILHASDNEAYRLPTAILKNNPHEHLSSNECMDLADYCEELGIKLIVGVGGPAHMGALAEMIKATHPNKADLFDEHNQIDYRSAKAKETIHSILREVNIMFGLNIYGFHLGGDEFTFNPENDGQAVVDWFNGLQELISDDDIHLHIWNDGLTKSNMAQLHPSIEVYYWTYTDKVTDPDALAQLTTHRATFEDLINAGVTVHNANNYYCYSVPSRKPSSVDYDYAARDALLNYTVGLWDVNHTDSRIYNVDRVAGSFFGIWGEHAQNVDTDTLIQYLEDHICTIGLITHAKASDIRTKYVDVLTANDFKDFVNECKINTAQINDPEESVKVDYRWGAARYVTLLNERDIHAGNVHTPLYIMGNARTSITLSHLWTRDNEYSWDGELRYYRYHSSNGGEIFIGDEVEVLGAI